ncbi:hypothetical protein Tco_0555384 [Tanacetum coccineum]
MVQVCVAVPSTGDCLLEDELRFQKSKSKRRRLTLVTSEDEEDLVAEDPSKHGRSLIGEMDLDARISLVPPHVEVQGRYGQNLETQKETLMEIRKSAAKDKGKAKIDETESPRKMKQRERAQISRDEEVAQNLQEDFDVAERQRMAQVHQAAQGFTDVEWDDVLARVVADEDFLEVQRLKRAGQEVLENPVKRQKIGEASGSGEEQSAEMEKELSEEELQKLLVIVLVEELVIQPLQFKGGLLGIRGFYNLMLLVQVCAADED